MSHWVAINVNWTNKQMNERTDGRTNGWTKSKTTSTTNSANLMSLYFNNSCIKPIWWSDGMYRRGTVHYGRVKFTWDLVICNALLHENHIFSDGPVHYWTLFHWLQLKKSFHSFSARRFYSFIFYPYFRSPFFHFSTILTLIVVFHFRFATISERMCLWVCA